MPSHKSFHRTDRISAQLRRDVGELVREAVREHGLPSVSVSDVEVTRDMDWATVWITALQAEQAPTALRALKELGGEFRRSLARGMRLRRVPELRFRYDDSVDKGERIEHLLRSDDAPSADEASGED